MANLPLVVTLDGGGSAGKGTLSLLLAQKLRWHLLDSGAIYRVLALSVSRHSLRENDEAAIAVHALQCDVQFVTETVEPAKIILSGDEFTEAIRCPDCGNLASRIADYSAVRGRLLE